jgi:phage shock protein C
VTGPAERADWSRSGEIRRVPTKECEVSTTTLTRPQQGKVIAGVCAGLAQRFGWNANVVRLLFLLSCLLPGPQFVIYLVLWFLIPKAPY